MAQARTLNELAFPQWLARIGISSLVLSALTATWGGTSLRFGPITDVLILVSLMVGAAKILCGGIRVRPPVWLWVPGAAVLLCLTVQVMTERPYSRYVMRYAASYFRPENEIKAAYWLVALVLVPLAIISCTSLDSRTPRMVLAAYLTGVCTSCVVAVSDLIGFTQISELLGNVTASNRQFGLTNHPNTLGLTCVLAMPMAMYFLNTTRRRWIPGIAVVVLLAGTVASGSRGAQAAVPLAALAALLLLPNRRRLIRQLTFVAGITLAAGAAVGIMVASAGLPERLWEIVRFGAGASATTSESDAGRDLAMSQAIDDFRSCPVFGLGLRHIIEAHNIYIQLLAGGGLVLLIAMLFYWSSAMIDAWRLHRWGESLGVPLLVSISGWLTLGVIENQITDRYLYYTIGCVAALMAARQHPAQTTVNVRTATGADSGNTLTHSSTREA